MTKCIVCSHCERPAMIAKDPDFMPERGGNVYAKDWTDGNRKDCKQGLPFICCHCNKPFSLSLKHLREYPLKPKKCDVRVYADTTICEACGLQWDTNDPQPASCLVKK